MHLRMCTCRFLLYTHLLLDIAKSWKHPYCPSYKNAFQMVTDYNKTMIPSTEVTISDISLKEMELTGGKRHLNHQI